MFREDSSKNVSILKAAALQLIKGYQWLVSPLFGNCCRFHPSCSYYALEAIERFGIVRGSVLVGWRLLRCHPFHPGGFDPVPNKKEE